MEREVGLLRAFRDAYLTPSPPGRSLIRAYYEWGPVMAGFIREHAILRPAARFFLTPFVCLSSFMMVSAATKLLCLLVAVALFFGSSVISRKTGHIRGFHG